MIIFWYIYEGYNVWWICLGIGGIVFWRYKIFIFLGIEILEIFVVFLVNWFLFKKRKRILVLK